MSGWKIICLHPLEDVSTAAFITREAAVDYIREHVIYEFPNLQTYYTPRSLYPQFVSLDIEDHCPDYLRGLKPVERCLLEPMEVS